MRVVLCKFCEERNALIMVFDDHGYCPRCYKNLFLTQDIPALPLRLPGREVHELNLSASLDEITAELMSIFLCQGMTVSKLSRQLGITRSTVYAKMKQYNLCATSVNKSPTIDMSPVDICISGIAGQVIKKDPNEKYVPSDRYCSKLKDRNPKNSVTGHAPGPDLEILQLGPG